MLGPQGSWVLSDRPLLRVLSDRVLLRVGLSPSKKVVFIWFNESSIKTLKNAFYFMLKALFILEIFKFLSWLFGYVEKRLDKKVKVNFKIYDVTDWTTNDSHFPTSQELKAIR